MPIVFTYNILDIVNTTNGLNISKTVIKRVSDAERV